MKKILLFAFTLCITAIANAQTYTTTTPVTGLAYPVAFTFTPDGRILVTLKTGTIKIFNNNGTAIGDFYNLSDSTYNNFERGLLGIEVDPDFATNHYVYAYYNHRYPNNSSGTASQQMRVVRFTENNNIGTNPTVILKISPGTIPGNHVGGNIRFRPSDNNSLYVAIGDIADSTNAPKLNKPYGKYLRINKDGSIPADNPFYDDGNPATGNDDRIWSYGHRNPFDFTFSTVNDSMYSAENGLNTWDEVNIVTHGKNYGWGICEGYYLAGSTTQPCNHPAFEPPIQTWGAPLPSVTGICFYTGCIMPELKNHLIVGDNNNGKIYNLTLGNAPAYDTVLSRTQILDVNALTTIKQGPDGYLYALNGGYVASGVLYKIAPTTPPTPITASIIMGIVPYESCVNNTVMVDASPGNDILLYDFTLSNGNNIYSVGSNTSNASITPSVAGVYDLQLIVSNDCQTDTDFVTGYITVFDEPVFTLNTHDSFGNNDGSAWLSDYSNVSSIQWNDISNNNPLISTNDSINGLSPGTYSVIVTNGGITPVCMQTDTFYIGLDAIGEHLIAPVKLFPNPANDRLYVDLKNAPQQNMTAQIYNATGALVMSQSVNGKALAEMAITALPNGIYYLLINGEKQRFAAKWVKQ